MKIKITADSTCDLSEALLRQWDISLMPMHILMGGESYLDGITVRPADVFAHVEAGGQTPKSAAANPVEYIDFFGPFAKEYDAVIHISVSAKLSSCYQNACLAAQEYDNVSVIDSENICTGQGYLVLRAAKWAADGLTAASSAPSGRWALRSRWATAQTMSSAQTSWSTPPPLRRTMWS